MLARSIREIEGVWTNVDGWRRLSDKVIGIGPVGIGLDGMLTWIPGVGDAYTVGAGAWLFWQAVRARASAATLVKMAAFIAFDTVTGAVPVAGAVVDTFWRGHAMAARALMKEIERTHWVEGSYAAARASGELDRHWDEMRAQPDKRRLVFLQP